MTALFLVLVLAQTQPAVRRSTPLSDDPGMVVRQAGTVTVTCPTCSGTGALTDGGLIGSVMQGTRPWLVAGADGGAVEVQGAISATNPSVGSTGAAVPTSATLIGGSDGTNLRAPWVLTTTPDAGDPGLVVRVVGGVGGSGGAVTQGTTPWLVGGADGGAVAVQGTVTADTELPTAAALTDADPNPTTPTVGAALMGWEPTGPTWNRVRTSPVNADAEAGHAQGALDTMSHAYFYNGATWDRMRGTIAGGLLVDVSDLFLLDATFTARINTLGQKTMANSTPVVLASDQSAVPVSGTVGVSNSFLLDATFTNRFAAAGALSDNFANPTTTQTAAMNMLWDGATWDRAPGNSTDGMLVNLGANNDVTVTSISAGTNYIGKTRLTDGTLDLSLLNSAPGSDTGQVSVPVRIISSLAGGAGGTSSSYGAAFPATGTAAGYSDGTNMQGGKVFDYDTGGGADYVVGAALRVPASGGSTNPFQTINAASPVSGGLLGTLVARANAAAPSWSEGNTVMLSTDLAGALRVAGTVTANAGSGTWATNLSQYGGVAVGAANALHVQPGTGATWTVQGDKSNNAATPGANNVGAFVATANASDPSYTDTRLVALSVDTAGWLRNRTGILVGASMRSAEGYDADTGAGSNYLPGYLLRFSASGGSVEAAAGAGATTSGTQRVVLPTDQTAIPVTQSGSWSLAANQSVNVAQMNGVAVSMGNGVSGTGVQRVTLASDSTGQVTLATGSNTIGALVANQSVNLSQVAGTTTATGNGVAGAGVQRVTIASDNTAFTVNAAQSGTWTVQPGNTANTTAWLVNAGQVASANNDGSCVSVSTTTTVLASNASRRQAAIVARMSNTDTVFIKFGATATTADFPLEPGQVYNLEGASRVYTGVIDAIANSGTQAVCVTEFN